ncbi:MAG: hypothetical protein PGN34_08010 [Methylobacterium frigidaeris]
MQFGAMRFLIALLTSLAVAACNVSPYHFQEPDSVLGAGPRVSDVVKSIRCEVTAFLVENKLRSTYVAPLFAQVQADTRRGIDHLVADKVDLVRQFPYIDIDSRQLGFLSVDLQNLDTRSMTIGYTRDKPSLATKAGRIDLIGSLGRGLGGSLTQTKASEFTHSYAILQNGDLGPVQSFSPRGETPPGAAKFSTVYNAQPQADEKFYCFKSLFKSKSRTLLDAIQEVQHLVASDPGWEEYENFTRIRVGGRTLAQWLQNSAAEMTSNEKTIYPTSENLLVGQLTYSFTLHITPELNGNYSLISGFINPLSVNFDTSTDQINTYTISLNTKYAAQVLSAATANTCFSGAFGPACP